MTKVKCTAHSSRTGNRCRRWPTVGGTVCATHGGRAPRVAAAAERRRAEDAIRRELGALADFRADGGDTDPIGTLLRRLRQADQRADLYAELLQRQYDRAADDADDQLPVGVKALIGHKYAIGGDGRPVPVEEAVRALVGLEAEERDRAVKYAKLALDAKVDERLTAAHETQVNMVADALGAALAEMGLSHGQQQEAAGRVARILRAVPG